MSNELLIRKAVSADLASLTDIYNEEVLHSTATLDIRPQSYEERRIWFDAHDGDRHPVFVAAVGGVPAGYVSLSAFRPKEGFDATVELSVYVAKDHRGNGIAKALMAHVLAYARSHGGIRTVISVITKGNDASVRLHERFGFSYCGCLPGVGFKFGKPVDSCFYVLPVD